jgi:tetratricopeptide (TPR) repeat protein
LEKGKKERCVYSVLGYCYFQTGDFKNSIDIYKDLIDICPDVLEYKFYYA